MEKTRWSDSNASKTAGEKGKQRTAGKERGENALGKHVEKPRSTFRYGIICTFFALFFFILLGTEI